MSEDELAALRILGPYSPSALAYLGDAVFEGMVRRHLVLRGISDAGELNRHSLAYVKAGKQSEAVERILPHLTPLEQTLYRRGRNGGGKAHPKAASAVEYRRATGLEALFGGLSLLGRYERLDRLFSLAFPDDRES